MLHIKNSNYIEFITILQITSLKNNHSLIHFCYGHHFTYVKSKKKILSIDTRSSKNILQDIFIEKSILSYLQVLWDVIYS